MEKLATVYTVDDFVRRVVDSLLRGGERRGLFLCSRCLVKLTRENLDKSYAKPEIARVMDDIFDAPGSITHEPTCACAGCGRKKVRCLGVPLP
jgi:hypothetical protein